MFNALLAQRHRTTSRFDSAISSSATTSLLTETATARSKSGPYFHSNFLQTSARLSEMPVERLGDLILRHRADDLLHYLPILEHQQSGDTANAVARGRIHRFIHVQLGHRELARIVLSNFRNRWRQHVARAAPFGPEIDHDGLRLACSQ